MATTTPTWTENVSLRSAANLSAGASSTHDIDLDTNGYDTVVVQIDVTVSSSSGVLVEFLASPDSGTTDDTTSLAPSYTVNADDRRTITLMALPYVQVKLTNEDGTNATGNISILYAGRKWSTA